MTNKEKYYFADFTQNHYCEILQLAKHNYAFANYENFKNKKSFIIWRHDVDFSMEYALELAKIEKSLNIESTYFLYLHSEFYNLFELRSIEIINKISKLGHNIGIHFDAHYYNIKSKKDINKYLYFEKKIFNELFNIIPKAFSFHNTNDFIMSCQDKKYVGLKNTYAKIFQTEIGYCSDSNGYWHFDRLYDVIKSKKYKKLQVLTHPTWWQEEIRSPRERIFKIIMDRKTYMYKSYEKVLHETDRMNIDW